MVFESKLFYSRKEGKGTNKTRKWILILKMQMDDKDGTKVQDMVVWGER